LVIRIGHTKNRVDVGAQISNCRDADSRPASSKTQRDETKRNRHV
jgi:hypothetical protein